MPDLPLYLSAAAAIVTGAYGLIRYGLRLWFLWRVYLRGGRTDLRAAADALRRSGPGTPRLPGRRRSPDEP